jgi:hypothetical protein
MREAVVPLEPFNSEAVVQHEMQQRPGGEVIGYEDRVRAPYGRQ